MQRRDQRGELLLFDEMTNADQIVAKYFDAFLYYANWGTRRLMLRVPSARLDPKVVKQYRGFRTGKARGPPSAATVTTVGAHLVIDLWSEDESRLKVSAN